MILLMCNSGEETVKESIDRKVETTESEEKASCKRVAAYCRISNDTDYAFQVKHYSDYIATHEEWSCVGIYVDRDICGAIRRSFEQYGEMLSDCYDGLIDIVIADSIQSVADNGRDLACLIEQIRSMENPIEMFFEKEKMWSSNYAFDVFYALLIENGQISDGC